MTTDDLRSAIRDRIADLGVTQHHAARLADLDPRQVDRYLSDSDATTFTALALAGAVGLRVSVAPVKGFRPDPPRPRGRPKATPEKSG